MDCDAAELLGEGLRRNGVLVDLSLEGNRIRSRGMARLADCLQTNSSLEVLNLSWNQVSLRRRLPPRLPGCLPASLPGFLAGWLVFVLHWGEGVMVVLL